MRLFPEVPEGLLMLLCVYASSRDFQAGKYSDATLSAVILAIFAARIAWRSRRARIILNRWAERTGYRVINARYRSFFKGPFFWKGGHYQAVYQVTVQVKGVAQPAGFVAVVTGSGCSPTRRKSCGTMHPPRAPRRWLTGGSTADRSAIALDDPSALRAESGRSPEHGPRVTHRDQPPIDVPDGQGTPREMGRRQLAAVGAEAEDVDLMVAAGRKPGDLAIVAHSSHKDRPVAKTDRIAGNVGVVGEETTGRRSAAAGNRKKNSVRCRNPRF